MKTTMEEKIKRAIATHKLNLEILGERKWYNYFIRVTELVWKRNFYDGYKVEVYNEKCGNHLETVHFPRFSSSSASFPKLKRLKRK
ncbi:MAG: hypothetical protein LBG92_09940 [Prevotellaceae bacterium]|jgi:hypothetical protein|nr:hypothetical protein [Prevotellaceae bacterium]